jgi:hypothetical protein
LTTPAWIDTSSAETGSSSTNTSGSSASARAMPMRWRWPPENSCGNRFACSGFNPTVWSRSAVRCRASALDTPWIRIGSDTVAATVNRGFSEA